MIRHFLRDDDVSPAEQQEILRLAVALKRDRWAQQSLAGPRSVAIIFDKPSTRTRTSFCVGISELGGYPLVIDTATSQLSRGESVADTVRVLSRQCVAIVWRTFSQQVLAEAAAFSSVPVINGLSDAYHPCQALADLLTIYERFGQLSGVRVAFLGDIASNTAASTALAMTLAGMHVRLAGPSSMWPSRNLLARAQAIGELTHGSVAVTGNPAVAVADADVVITDTWFSMGTAADAGVVSDREQRRRELLPYQVTTSLLKLAQPGAVILHCLPAHRGDEIAAEVLDGRGSAVWDQAENRLHVQKALLTWLLAIGAAERGESGHPGREPLLEPA